LDSRLDKIVRFERSARAELLHSTLKHSVVMSGCELVLPSYSTRYVSEDLLESVASVMGSRQGNRAVRNVSLEGPPGVGVIVPFVGPKEDRREGVGFTMGPNTSIFVGSVQFLRQELDKILRSLSGPGSLMTVSVQLSKALEDLVQASARIVDLVEANESLRAALAVRDLHIEYLRRQLDCVRDAQASGRRAWLMDAVALLGLVVATFGVGMDRVDNAEARNFAGAAKECSSQVTNITNIINAMPPGSFQDEESPFAG
jgi:hypothetical protein